MTGDPTPSASLAADLQRAYEEHDLELMGSLMTDDVRWGDVAHPRGCRNRSDVVATFSRLMEQGVTGRITEVHEGPGGVVCRLSVDLPEGVRGPDDQDLFHVYTVRDGRISEIRRFDDRHSALEAAGLADPG